MVFSNCGQVTGFIKDHWDDGRQGLRWLKSAFLFCFGVDTLMGGKGGTEGKHGSILILVSIIDVR